MMDAFVDPAGMILASGAGRDVRRGTENVESEIRAGAIGIVNGRRH